VDGAGSLGNPARVSKTHETTKPAKRDSSKEKPEWHVLTGIADETWRTGKRMTVKKEFSNRMPYRCYNQTRICSGRMPYCCCPCRRVYRHSTGHRRTRCMSSCRWPGPAGFSAAGDQLHNNGLRQYMSRQPISRP